MPESADPDAAAEQILRTAEAGAIESGARDESRRRAARREQGARDDAVLASLRGLEAEVRHLKVIALQPRNGFLRLFVRDLETNPRAQYSVHKWGAWFWLANFPAVTALFFFSPSVWLRWGLYVTLLYSLYANFATDYSGMSAAMAAEGGDGLPPIPAEPYIPDEDEEGD